MRRRQLQKSSAAFCVKSASCPPTELLLSPGLVLPVLGQVFGEYGKKSTCAHAMACSRLLRPAVRQARATARQLKSYEERLVSPSRLRALEVGVTARSPVRT